MALEQAREVSQRNLEQAVAQGALLLEKAVQPDEAENPADQLAALGLAEPALLPSSPGVGSHRANGAPTPEANEPFWTEDRGDVGSTLVGPLVVRANPLAKALAEAHVLLGKKWRSQVHASHALSLAKPLVYCRKCGAYAGSVARMRVLRGLCPAKPALEIRLRNLMGGLHPEVAGKRLERAMPLPPGEL